MAITQRERRRREVLRDKIAALRNSVEMAEECIIWHGDELRRWRKIAADERRRIRKLQKDLAK